MFCEKHQCKVKELAQRTSGDVIIKIGKCDVGKEVIMEKWRKIRATNLKFNPFQIKALMRVVSYEENKNGKII